MDERQLQERGNQLEEEFFHKQNAEILAKMRAGKAEEEERAQMAAALGVDNMPLIDNLRSHGVTPATLSAVALAPLVLVAWADKTLEKEERAAVLKEASAQGVSEGTPGFALLDSWLAERPDPGLLAAWTAYAQGVTEALEGAQREDFCQSILKRAQAVAGAAGGIIGLGKVSGAEKQVLDQIETALTA